MIHKSTPEATPQATATPRTDAALLENLQGRQCVSFSDFARSLERELAEAESYWESDNNVITGLRRELGAMQFERDEARKQHAAAKEDTARLVEALEPFSKLEVDSFGNVRDENTYLWKPSHNRREMAGISVAHVMAARIAYAAMKQGATV